MARMALRDGRGGDSRDVDAAENRAEHVVRALTGGAGGVEPRAPAAGASTGTGTAARGAGGSPPGRVRGARGGEDLRARPAGGR
ncbi:hypothetical protein M2169_000812 [Streptomyces sp. MJP52]|nr:hypothetical protein [Streptomyces sp. MJP52]